METVSHVLCPNLAHFYVFWALGDGIDSPNPDRNGIFRILTEMLKVISIEGFISAMPNFPTEISDSPITFSYFPHILASYCDSGL